MVGKNVKKIVAFLYILMSTIILPGQTSLQQNTLCDDIYQLTSSNNPITPLLYIKHLTKSFHFLSHLYKQNYCYKPCNIIKEKDCIYVDSIVFFHHKIRFCLNQMLQTKSLKPLLKLLQEVKNHGLLQDNIFMRELLLLVFTVHKQIIFNECADNPYVVKQITLETILEISEKINQLPIAEVLNAIDMLVRELPPFLEKYEFNSSISWKAWLKKYWWVPPIFTGWFGLKILLSLQRPQFYYSTYLSPKPQVPIQPIMTNDPALIEIRHS